MPAKKVVIFGIGEMAQLAHFYLSKDSPHDVVAFTVHEKFLHDGTVAGLGVVPFERIEEIYPPSEFSMFVGVGYTKVNRGRAQVYEQCKQKGYTLISYVCSKNAHWNDFEMGDNCFIMENNVIQPFVKIGNDVIIACGNVLGHHLTIADHCFIAAQATIAGNCEIASGAFIGHGAIIKDRVKIAAHCVVGAGALILKNTVEDGVYRGLESKPMRITSKQLPFL
ncbi:MAG: acetyltransferase [Desulfomonile tiedjei]|nr:acetyltransferase [Desulfomonile tiedjei]